MYAYIRGELVEKNEDLIVIESNGIGYEIFVPGKIMEELPDIGNEIRIYTYFYVREDSNVLYGFLTKEDKYIFKLLLGVSGIGPKGALAILSVLSPDDLRFAVLSEDVKTISKAPGVGTKTAQRLIIELKDKLSLEEAFTLKSEHEANVVNSLGTVKTEAIEALVALGYQPTEAAKAVRMVDSEIEDVEGILKSALRHMSSF